MPYLLIKEADILEAVVRFWLSGQSIKLPKPQMVLVKAEQTIS